MIELDGIAPLRGPRPKGAPRAHRRASGRGTSTGSPRRAVLRGAAAAGAALGLSALGVFSPARRALAGGFRLLQPCDQVLGSYEIYDRCPPYASRHDCSPGCGPSLVCRDCCRTSGTMIGYHHSSTSRPGYRLRPDQCFGGTYDGWLWRYAARCGQCTGGVLYRCHDGWKRSRSGHWYKTICRSVLDCARSAAAGPGR